MLRTPEQIEAREAVLRMKMQRLAAPGPVAVEESAPSVPQPKPPFSTPGQVAKRWNVSVTSIRRWFRAEPGVMQWGRGESRPGKKKAHLSMRIPIEVEERVRRRMTRA